jgi:hypothetical protein
VISSMGMYAVVLYVCCCSLSSLSLVLCFLLGIARLMFSLCVFSPSTGNVFYSRRGRVCYCLGMCLCAMLGLIDIDTKLGDGMFGRKNKKKTYDVQVKAVKPSKVVTIARVGSYERAAEIRDGLTAIGFEVMVSWKHYDGEI